MNRDVIDINDATILVESAHPREQIIDACKFDEPIIGVAFYGSGDVTLSVNYGDKTKNFSHTKGMVLSFYANEHVEFVHHISPDRPLNCIVIVTALRYLPQLPNNEADIFQELLSGLVSPSDHFVEGPPMFMTPDMLHTSEQMLHNTHAGKLKMMFFRSQATTLLSHYFGELALQRQQGGLRLDYAKLHQAKEILLNNLENPPSLNELSKQIGLNTNKLKKEFKAHFGLPVFKYLQNERLSQAYHLIQEHGMGVQEAAWHVGYDSLSSFSNAFEKKFGFRPSQVA